MSTSVFPEVGPPSADSPQAPLPLATQGVLRYVWQSKFGPILIEIAGEQIRVNGAVVQRAVSPSAGR